MATLAPRNELQRRQIMQGLGRELLDQKSWGKSPAAFREDPVEYPAVHRLVDG